MRRWIPFAFVVLSLCISCSSHQKGSEERGNVIPVVISVNDGGYDMPQTAPDPARIPVGYKIHWYVVNNTTDKLITDCWVDQFDGDGEPFDDGKNPKYDFGQIDHGKTADKHSGKAIHKKPNGQHGETPYGYCFTAIIDGANHPPTCVRAADGRIIIIE